MPSRPDIILCIALSVAGLIVSGAAGAQERDVVSCTMQFTMEGWSVFYKTADGEGEVNCNNGQHMVVRLSSRGGGITFGKSSIRDGWGEFTGVNDIRDVLGAYAAAEVEAGAMRSAQAQVVTKGSVTLALKGNGDGWNLGVSVGKFTLEPR